MTSSEDLTTPDHSSTARPPIAIRRRPRRRYIWVATTAALAVLGGLVGPRVYSAVTDTSAKDRIAADPPPTLFPADATARIDALTKPQVSRAARLLAPWWRSHGTAANDSAFVTWLERDFPEPPSAAVRKREMGEVQHLDRKRTDQGVAAATWLETYGKKDVWKLEAHDQGELLPASTADQRKRDVDDLLAMSKQVADSLGTRFQESAPYVLEPALRTDHSVAPGDTCPCSYPSRHAGAASAARTYLAHFTPQRDGDFRYFQDQIDYSRLYMAGHVASDISAGSLLGDMIGDYFLVTRAGVAPEQV